jgi:hypothetical protein
MSAQTHLDIFSDTEAFIYNRGKRWKLEGGLAANIIANYRHCLTHAETGETDAALYLWGLIDGLHHSAFIHAQETIERLSSRQLASPELFGRKDEDPV